MQQFGSTFKSQISQQDKDVFMTINPYHLKYGFLDFLVLLTIFILGYLLSSLMSSYRRDQRKQLDEILKEFEGHKSEYENSVKKTKQLLTWKYRVKLVEKCYYIMVSVFGFIFYKTPSLTQRIIYDNAAITVPLFAASIIFFNYTVWYLEQEHARSELRTRKLKQQQKDIKLQLLSKMDPIVVETLRSIVRKDMRSEIEEMRNSDKGCSMKCQLIKKISDIDLARN